MNIRNKLITDILEYNYKKCSEEKLLKHKNALRNKSNMELCKLYMKKVHPKKKMEQFVQKYIQHVENLLGLIYREEGL